MASAAQDGDCVGGKYKGRYGIPGEDLDKLITKWSHYIKKDSVWKTFDEFVLWVSTSEGFDCSAMLRKYDETKPHGPENSFWYIRGRMLEEKRNKMLETRGIVSPYCEGCEHVCTNQSMGCPGWRQYWVKHWNETICSNPNASAEQQKNEVFQYEHPDLVREGIVFEMRTD